MRYKNLGNTGVLVSELCLGAMTFGSGVGHWEQIGALQQEEAEPLIKTAFDAGINFIDTANDLDPDTSAHPPMSHVASSAGIQNRTLPSRSIH